MLPPLPPSPPDGPPRGTYFSRRKATHPLPPLPAFTKILASSTNKAKHPCQIRLPARAKSRKRFGTSRTARSKTFLGGTGIGLDREELLCLTEWPQELTRPARSAVR